MHAHTRGKQDTPLDLIKHRDEGPQQNQQRGINDPALAIMLFAHCRDEAVAEYDLFALIVNIELRCQTLDTGIQEEEEMGRRDERRKEGKGTVAERRNVLDERAVSS